MKNRGIDKQIVLLLITTLITALTWTGMEVYRAYKKVNLPEGVEERLTPLNPNLNTSVLDILTKKEP